MPRWKAMKVTLTQVTSFYEQNKAQCLQASQEAIALGQGHDARKLFPVLCNQVLASRVSWHKAVAAVNDLNRTGELWTAGRDSIERRLRQSGFRFPKRGAGFICDSRQSLYCSGLIVPLVRVLETLCSQDPVLGRNILAGQNKDTEILVEGVNMGRVNLYVPGIRMKWASHFLSELGFSHNQLAVLDSHVLQLLVCFEVLKSAPESLIPGAYLDIEEKMKTWATSNLPSIPLDHLNWVLWAI